MQNIKIIKNVINILMSLVLRSLRQNQLTLNSITFFLPIF